MTVAAVVAAQTVYQQTSPNEYLFPGLCKKANGDFLMVARKASGHLVSDGQLVVRTSATGLAGSWSSESIIFSPGNIAAGIPRLLDDGRVVIACWYNVGGVTPHVTTTLVSTDETCTSWVRGGDLPDQTGGGAAWGGNACESPVVVMPDGTWLLPTYTPEAAGDCAYSAALYESTDEGDTWTFRTYIARAPVALPRVGQLGYDEPWLLHIDGNELLCAVRVAELGWGDGTGRYTYLYRSTDAGDTWTSEGRLNSTHQHASRMAMCRNPLTGTIMLHHRLLSVTAGVAWSGHGAYYWSNDDGATWSAGKGLDSEAALPSNPTAPPLYSYGDIVAHDGGFAALWADETPISGSGSAIRFATYSDDAPPAVTGSDVAAILADGASIVGNVNPNSAATSYHVEYGETTSYGSSTSPVSAGSGSSLVAVEVPLSGLDSGTAYHARIVATNANGTTNGPDIPFTTDTPPPSDVGLTLHESGVWTQDGTSITARALIGRRSTVNATAYSENGGPIWGDGEQTDRFDIDGETIDGESTIVLEPATPRLIELGVTPQDGDELLTLRLGIPE